MQRCSDFSKWYSQLLIASDFALCSCQRWPAHLCGRNEDSILIRQQSVLVIGATVTCTGGPWPGSRASPSNTSDTGGLCFLCSQVLSCLRRKLCQVWQHTPGIPGWQEASLCFPGRLSLNKREKNKKQRGLKGSSQDPEREIEDYIV